MHAHESSYYVMQEIYPSCVSVAILACVYCVATQKLKFYRRGELFNSYCKFNEVLQGRGK